MKEKNEPIMAMSAVKALKCQYRKKLCPLVLTIPLANQ